MIYNNSTMQTPIDFGKNFIYNLYRLRDAEAASQALSDDIVWVTPDGIFHLKTKKEILDFINSLIGRDPQPFNVDVASIKSALVPGDTNTVVYDVNLIPKREQDSVNMRCSLSIHTQGEEHSIIFVGMSRKYEHSQADQIREFIENIPAGLMVLVGTDGNAGTLRELYVNSVLAGELGYEDNEFYDNSDVNPFFMVPHKEEKKLRKFCENLMKNTEQTSGSMRVHLETLDSRKIPCQVSAKVAYRDETGSRTILYLLFADLTSVLEEVGEEHRKIEENLKTVREDEIRDRLLALDADTVRAKEQAEKEAEEARKQIEETGKLIQQAREAVQLSHQEAEERVKAAREKAREEALQEAETIRQEAEKVRTESEEKVKEAEALTQEEKTRGDSLQEELDALRREKEEEKASSQEQIRELEKKLQDESTMREQQKSELRAAYDQELKAAELASEKKKEEEKKKLQGECDVRLDTLRREMDEKEQDYKRQIEEIRAEQEGNKQGYLLQIERLKEEISQKELGLKKQDTDNRVREKEKSKTVGRIRYLVGGQMNAIESLAAAAVSECGGEREKQIQERIENLSAAVPGMLTDLEEIAKIDPSERNIQTAPFLLSDCLNTVRKVIRPQCREKDIIFSCETNGTVPDAVIGSKPGLQLAFLCILENAVHNTASGGKIILTAVADAPVRDSAYFHFMIQDTGSGIPDDRLPVLFDDPASELSIARKVISSMGGSIQVRSSYGSGSRFEISVSLQLGGNAS